MKVRILTLGLALLLLGCTRDEAPNPTYFEALVELDNSGVYLEEAYTVKNIRAKSLTIEQSIDKQRKVEILQLGFLLSKSPNPTYDPDNSTVRILPVPSGDQEFPGMFSAKALDLDAFTTYFIRAFVEVELNGEPKILQHPLVETVKTATLFSHEVNRTPDNIQLISRLNDIEEHLNLSTYGLLLSKDPDQLLDLEHPGWEKVERSDDFPFELFTEHHLNYNVDLPLQRYRPFYTDVNGEAFYGEEQTVFLFREVSTFQNPLELKGALVQGSSTDWNGQATGFLLSADPDQPNALHFLAYDPYETPLGAAPADTYQLPDATDVQAYGLLGLPGLNGETRFCGQADGKLLLGTRTLSGTWSHSLEQPDWGSAGSGGCLKGIVYDADINSFFFFGEGPPADNELLFVLRTNFEMVVNTTAQYHQLDFITAPFQRAYAIAEDPGFGGLNVLLLTYETQTAPTGPMTYHFALVDKMNLDLVYQTTTEAAYFHALTLPTGNFLLVGSNAGIGEFRLVAADGTTVLRRPLPDFEAILGAQLQSNQSVILTGYNADRQLVFAQISVTGNLRWTNTTEMKVDLNDEVLPLHSLSFQRSQHGLIGVHQTAGTWYERRLNANGTLNLE